VRLRPLSEAECHARLYPRADETVTVLPARPRRARARTWISGEELRRRFEERLDARDDEEAA
jgi:hypothetical protein